MSIRFRSRQLQFSIVSSRFVFHHLQDPLAALKEMKRVCKPGGKIVVADMARMPEKAAALNAAELLRDPSHVRALPVDELLGLFQQAGLDAPQIFSYRMEGELEDLMSRSFPNEGDADRVRKIYADSILTTRLISTRAGRWNNLLQPAGGCAGEQEGVSRFSSSKPPLALYILYDEPDSGL